MTIDEKTIREAIRLLDEAEVPTERRMIWDGYELICAECGKYVEDVLTKIRPPDHGNESCTCHR